MSSKRYKKLNLDENKKGVSINELIPQIKKIVRLNLMSL